VCIREQSLSRGASQSAVRRRWLILCAVWPSHSQWPSEQISFITTMHLPILQLSVQAFLAKLHITQVCPHPTPYSPDLAPCDFWLFQNPKSPLLMWRSHSTQDQSTASQCRLTGPHGTVFVHGRTVGSPLTGCQGISRPRDRFSRYSKWLNNFRTALVGPLLSVCEWRFMMSANTVSSLLHNFEHRCAFEYSRKGLSWSWS